MVTDPLFNCGLIFNSVVRNSHNSFQNSPAPHTHTHTHTHTRAHTCTHTHPCWKLEKILFWVLKITDHICKLFECPLMSFLSPETKANFKEALTDSPVLLSLYFHSKLCLFLLIWRSSPFTTDFSWELSNSLSLSVNLLPQKQTHPLFFLF